MHMPTTSHINRLLFPISMCESSIRSRVAGPLVHLERINLPVSLLERRRIVGHKVGAASLRRAAAGAPGVTGPVAAEGCVEDLFYFFY